MQQESPPAREAGVASRNTIVFGGRDRSPQYFLFFSTRVAPRKKESCRQESPLVIQLAGCLLRIAAAAFLWYLKVCDASADSLLSSKVARPQAKSCAAKNFAATWLRMNRVFVYSSALLLAVLSSHWMRSSEHFVLSKNSLSMKNLSMMMSLSTLANALIPSG